mmetsp:Transcript_13743/g.31848  ORF Transcript_13743/g.31848 Transcript_13743/m.31848 type:complete len:239 (-) Transcript_13743:9873-10589(-)
MFCSSRFLIQLRPCPWGSTNSGQREALVTRIPFWMERSSVGRPWMFHSPTSASVASILVIWSEVVSGTLRDTRSLAKYTLSSVSRNVLLKGPQYDMNAHASAQSPTRRLIWSAKSWDCCVQRSFSPARPVMSAVAESMRRLVRSRSSCSCCFSAMALSNLACMASSSPCALASSASAPLSFFCAMASSRSLTVSASILGITTLAITWYLAMARTQAHRPAAMEEAERAFSTVKSSFCM